MSSQVWGRNLGKYSYVRCLKLLVVHLLWYWCDYFLPNLFGGLANFDLACNVLDETDWHSMKLTGTRCSSTHWISYALSLTWQKRFLEDMEIFLPPKDNFLHETIFPGLYFSVIAQWNEEEKLSFRSTGSVKNFEGCKKQRNLITITICHAKRSIIHQLISSHWL